MVTGEGRWEKGAPTALRRAQRIAFPPDVFRSLITEVGKRSGKRTEGR